MGDWVDREHVLAAFNTGINNLVVDGKANANRVERYLNRVLDKIKSLPSAEEESFEWCTDCKEYDQESHCCHRFTKVIRQTVEEMKLVHCVDCAYSEYDVTYGDRYCHYNGKADVVDDYHFCRDGERRGDG